MPWGTSQEPHGSTYGGQQPGYGQQQPAPQPQQPQPGYGQQPGYGHPGGYQDGGYGAPDYGAPDPAYNPYRTPRPDAQPGGVQPGAVPPQAHPFPPQQPPHQREQAQKGSRQALVRPYAMTGGRTRPRYQLAIEALISTTDRAAQAPGLLPEHQRIVHLCQQVKSVAEISALLSIPLGVARILVADLAEAGLVAIHQPGSTEAGQPDVTLLERVLSGLRKL
ncbi:hypothetical protein BIV57_09985 [Mangrovactinospora gilvigrisea]|uniref:DUF742 domain-containing protein n=2 Tax=Mangrovactinospora gilvigrisea TaxID=1428644 RepID=A0A1J7BG40_9ACTN|nr:hypothetical protein BIV57_09985 [Mangrovactinospora gilvigrisea]